MDARSRAGYAVLIVEDNVDARDIFAFSLRAVGYEVMEAENGRHALAVIQERIPAAILTDLRMPEMNGLELAKALQSLPQYADIPRILLTATPISDKWAALSVFAIALSKPIALDELVQTIDLVIGLA